MAKKLFKSTPIYFKDMTAKVDRENGIIKDVVIANHGWDKTEDYMDDVFLKSLVEHGSSAPQGLKSRFGHPTMCKEGLGTYIGRFKNFRYEETPTGKVKAHVIADLHLDEVAKKSPGGDLYTYTLDMAEKNNDMFGNSIAFMPNDSEVIKIDTEGGEKEIYAIRMKSFLASDMVDSPAATENLFKSSEGNYAAKASEFLDENPELFEILSANPEILKEFLLKYHIYKNQKSMAKKTKSIYQAFKDMTNKFVKELNGEGKKSITATNEEAGEITITSETDTPAVGDPAEDKDGKPAKDGDYVQGENTIVVAGGKVSEVKPKGVEEEEEEETEEETADQEKIAKEFADLTVKCNKQAKQIKDQETAIAGLKKDIEDIKKSIKTDYEPKKKKSFVPADKKTEKDSDEEKPLTVAQRAAKGAK